MNDRIKRIIARLDGLSKDIDDFKSKFSNLCRVLVESFNLESCLALFHEANPILDRFVVSSPESDYEDIEKKDIIGIERELLKENKPVTSIPIMYKTKKIGALLLLLKKESLIDNNGMETLKTLAGKCADAIAKLVVFEGRQLLMETTRELVLYKKKVGQDFEKDDEIIFTIAMGIVVPTRVYIACKIDDGSYVYSHILAADGIIEDNRKGTFKEDNFEFMINEVKRDEPGIMEIEIKDQGKAKGILMIAYEQMGSVFDEEIKKILLVLSPNFASLVELNHRGE